MDERGWDDLLAGGALKVRESWERDPLSEGRLPLPRRAVRPQLIEDMRLRGRREELGHLELPLSCGLNGGRAVIYEHPDRFVRGHEELAMLPLASGPRDFYVEGDLIGFGRYPESWLVSRFGKLGGGGARAARPGSPLAAILTVFFYGETPELFDVGFRLEEIRPGDPSSGYFDAVIRPVVLVRNQHAEKDDPPWDLVELPDSIELGRGEVWPYFGAAPSERVNHDLPARYGDVRRKVGSEIDGSGLRTVQKQTRYFGWVAALDYVSEQLGLRISRLLLEGLATHGLRALAAFIAATTAHVARSINAGRPPDVAGAAAAGARGAVTALLWSRVHEIREHPFGRSHIRIPYGAPLVDVARAMGHVEAAPVLEQYARSVLRMVVNLCGARLAQAAAGWDPASGETALSAALRTALAILDPTALTAALREAPATVRYARHHRPRAGGGAGDGGGSGGGGGAGGDTPRRDTPVEPPPKKRETPKVTVKIKDPLRAVCAKGAGSTFKAVGDPPGGTYSWSSSGNVSIDGSSSGETVVVKAAKASGAIDDSTLTVTYTKDGSATDTVKVTAVNAEVRDEAGAAAAPKSVAKGAKLKLKGIGKPAGGAYSWRVGSGPIKIVNGASAETVEIEGTAASGAVDDCELILDYTVQGVTCTAKVKLTVVSIEKLQYKVKGAWKDVPSPLGPLCPGSKASFKAIPKPAGATFPAGMPVWGGDAAGAGEENTVTFGTSGARTVSAKCGDEKKVDVNVAAANAAVTITWKHDSVTDNTNGSATTKEKPFTATYEACADIAKNEWHLRVKSISGGTDMHIKMGGFSTPQAGVNITTQAQAVAAINDMLLEGAAGGPAATWVTEAAIRAHEQWHVDEWVQTSEHYWPKAEAALEKKKVDYDANENNMAGAVAAMQAGASGADAKVADFKKKCRDYWFTLGDSPGDRPYRAGGVVLNGEIQSIRNHGAAQVPPWVLPAGSNPAPAADHCYQPWLPYNP